MSAVSSHGLNPAGWKKVLLLRAGALLADIGAALFLAFLGVLLAQLMNLADGTGRFLVPALFSLFILLCTLGLSIGNATVGLAVTGSSIGKNLLRVLALLVPGYNVFDFVYAIRNPNHQTFTDLKLGVRVVVDTLR